MSEPQAAPRKPSFWQTLRTGWGPYKRLYAYVKPYRWRFAAGLALGFAFGVSNGFIPLVIAKVTGAPAKDGSLRLNTRGIEFADGKKLSMGGSNPDAEQPK